MASITATDRYTVTVTLKRPDAGWAPVLATVGGIFEKKFQQEHGAAFGKPGTGLMDTGPMEIQSFDPTTGVELTARDAPSSFAQLDQVVPVARGVVEFGEAVGEPWRGARPTLPDSLPMIGPAPRHDGLWLAFGNQHIGFTTGPATGAAIAAMIGGAPPPFDVSAFSPSRYL